MDFLYDIVTTGLANIAEMALKETPPRDEKERKIHKEARQWVNMAKKRKPPKKFSRISDLVKKSKISNPFQPERKRKRKRVRISVAVPPEEPLPVRERVPLEAKNIPLDPRKQGDSDDEKKHCKLCFDAYVSTVIIDCGHSFMCNSCARLEPEKCFICNVKIVEGIRTLFPC